MVLDLAPKVKVGGKGGPGGDTTMVVAQFTDTLDCVVVVRLDVQWLVGPLQRPRAGLRLRYRFGHTQAKDRAVDGSALAGLYRPLAEEAAGRGRPGINCRAVVT